MTKREAKEINIYSYANISLILVDNDWTFNYWGIYQQIFAIQQGWAD